jgi:hypothetical protein
LFIILADWLLINPATPYINKPVSMKKVFCITLFITGIVTAFTVNAQTPKAIAANAYSLPQIMIRLCCLSYITDTTANKNIVKDSVKRELGMDVVWGPKELFNKISGDSYSSMYVAKFPDRDDYVVVIRGTNFTSLESWIDEDFLLHKSVKFSRYVNAAPKDAKISKGTCIGINDLIKLKDHNNYGNVVSFLKQVMQTKSLGKLYVTGHSLGGTLTPPFYAYLCYKLFGGPAPDSVATGLYSFAGLTAGDAGFNSFLQNYTVKAEKNWRFVNQLDVAPNLWAAKDSVVTIYAPYSLSYGLPESAAIDLLFYRADRNKYLQPPGSALRLPTVFNTSSAQNTWVTQAEYQHHSTTYRSLIDVCCTKKE